MRIAIMPARGGSKRIPRKNIVDFCGRPLLSYALDAARASGLFDVIHVSTEDDVIADAAASLGYKPDFKRDPALADDHTPIVPVLQWVLHRYAERGQRFDTVCLLMPAAPLIEAQDLIGALKLFERHDGMYTVIPVATFPCPAEWAMRLDGDGRLTPIQAGLADVRSQDLPKAYYDSGTFAYFSSRTVLAYPAGRAELCGYVIPRYKAVDIDDREDLELAERLFRGHKAP
jgi:pseudaminic acid cytidylyltransferase